MIGFYDYTVVLTYISLLSSVFGMTQAIDGRFRVAIFCLAFSGLCDMFDGKVARTKKERTEDEKLFGIQIDSLCDVICFGIFPVMICYLLGLRGTLSCLALGYYSVCAVIRLGFFNVLETNRQRNEEGANKYYHGLPITSIAVILPLIFLLSFVLPTMIFKAILFIMLFVVGSLFVIDFKFKKPSNKMCLAMVLVVGAAVGVIVLFSKYYVRQEFLHERPLIDEIIEGESTN